MRKILLLGLLCYSSLSFAAFSGKLDTYAWLLTSPTSLDVKVGAQSLLQDGVKDTAIMDLAAERFCIYVNRDADMDTDDNEDTVSWIAKALGGSGDAKYRALLQQALQKTKSSENKKYISKALASLQGDAPAYTPACPSLEDLRAQVTAGRTPANVTRGQMASIKKGDSLDAVYKLLGVPAYAAQWTYQTFRPFVGRLNLDDLEVFYGDAGNVRFDYGEDHWEVYEVLASAEVAGVAPAGPDHDLMQRMLSGDPEVYSQAAQDMIDNRQFPVDVLDAAGLRVWQQRSSTDGDAVDGFSYMCELLGESHNVRYRSILTAISQQAADKKLRKYAKKSLDMLPAGDAEQLAVPAS